MKITQKATWTLLASSLFLAACSKKDSGTLEGPVPTASFTSTVDASQFPVRVTFTDTSQDAFQNIWDFGDNTTGKGTTVTHTYNTPGTYQVRLTESGRGGTASTKPTDVVVPSACAVGGFAALTNCNGNTPSSRVWTYSSAAGAVKRFDASNNVISSSVANALTSCQADDQFTFGGTSYSYTYESNGKTFANGDCGDSQSGSTTFIFKSVTGGLGQIILQKVDKKPDLFIGEAAPVNNLTYDIIEASSTVLRLRGTLTDGTKTEVTLVPFDAVTRVKQLLTNGTKKTWQLDNSQAAAIVVGTEANPTQYYAGGPANSLPACQTDDEFTFSADTYIYDAKAETFVSGSPGSCQAARSGSSPLVFGPADGTGLAQIVLATKGAFIGITDAPDLTYRIISINDKNMTLRAGTGKSGGTVFTMKLIAK